MLRLVLASALLCVGASLRLDFSQHVDSHQLLPDKKVTGPEHRRCKVNRKTKHEEEVIGGTIVNDPAEFPFLAWLGDQDGSLFGQFCGGTLISDRVVLTAGHCLYQSDKQNAKMWVRLRLANFEHTVGIARDVINWRRHPHYDKFKIRNDLSLLLLNESVPAELVTPIQISDGTMPFEHGGQKTVVGWGSTDEQCAIYDTLLRKAEVPMGEDAAKCNTKGSKTLTARDDFDHKSQCCAGDFFHEMHYPGCGDSGGPLMAKEEDTWYQVGMVSWSYGVPWPDVFTRVSYFKDWINATKHELLASGAHPQWTMQHPA